MRCDIERTIVRFLAGFAGEKDAIELEEKLARLIGKLRHDKPNVEFDFLFPSSDRIEVWRKCGGQSDLAMPGLELLSDGRNDFQNGELTFTKVKCEKGTVHVKLDRKAFVEDCLKRILSQGLRRTTSCVESWKVINCEDTRIEGSTPTSKERCARFCKIAANLSKLGSKKKGSIFRVGCSDAKYLRSSEDDHDAIPLSVGAVINPDTKKKDTERTIEAIYGEISEEKRDISQDRMNEAMSEEQFQDQVHTLAHANIQFQLFQTSLAQPCVLKTESGLEDLSSFVLYNVARIVHVFRAFSEEGRYPDLPKLEQINLGENLVQQEEFELVFDHIAEYESLLESIVQDLEKGQAKVHLLIRFLVGLSHSFSRYYNRFKILKDIDEPSKMFARLYLIKAVKLVLVHGLEILDIQPIYNM